MPRWFDLTVSLLCVALMTSAPASAQSAAEVRMKTAVAELAPEDSQLIGKIQTGRLEEDGKSSFTFNLEAGKTYWVYGACDDCEDLNLEGKNPRGDVLDYDDGDDADPVLLVSERSPIGLVVTVSMKTCKKASCAFGIGLYEGALVWPGGPPQQ